MVALVQQLHNTTNNYYTRHTLVCGYAYGHVVAINSVSVVVLTDGL